VTALTIQYTAPLRAIDPVMSILFSLRESIHTRERYDDVLTRPKCTWWNYAKKYPSSSNNVMLVCYVRNDLVNYVILFSLYVLFKWLEFY